MDSEFLSLRNEISLAFEDIKEFPCFIHSDLFKIGIPVRKKIDKNFLCLLYDDVLQSTCTRGLLIPTFNYEFCSNGVYSVRNSVSQIGILSDYFRNKYFSLRTTTPVFSVIAINYNYQDVIGSNVFGSHSIFEALEQSDAWICFLGAGFDSNTFIHYVEEVNKVGYRYIKHFSGVVIDAKEEKKSVTIDYRVRPMITSSCNYRWDFLERELIDNGLLFQKKICHGRLLYYRAKDVLNFWTEKIGKDELYLLTEESRAITMQLYAKYGKPLSNIE